MKRFGGRERPKPEKFELETIVDGGTNVHEFQMIPSLQAGDMVALMDALDEEPEKAAGLMGSILRKVMDDTDGTPAKWTPPTLASLGLPPKTDPADAVWTGPDNEPYTLADTAAIDKFLDPANGSSRRRWQALMDPRNDEGIHLMDLVDIGEWVVSLSTDRPTQARTPSSRASRKNRR